MEFKTSLSQFWFPEIDPISFTPAQFHFHKGKGKYRTTRKDDGSEHTLNGKHFDLEMHIVNLNLNKETKDKFLAAVIGILFLGGDEDHMENFADRFFAKLFNDEVVDFNEEFFKFLDMNKRFVYRGSLTTPPYSEPLLWNVLPDVVVISQKTLRYFGGDKRVEKEFNDDG